MLRPGQGAQQAQQTQPAGYPASQTALPVAVAKAVPAQAAVSAGLPVSQAVPVAAPTPSAAPTSQPAQSTPSPKAESAQSDFIPPVPAGFSELNRLGVPELQYMHANELALDDWILDLPQVRTFVDRLHDTRQENAAIAKSILDLEGELNGVVASYKSNCEELVAQRAVVQGLIVERDGILKQHSPEAYSKALEAEAQEADDKAETLVQEAMDEPGMLSQDALAQLRKSYVQHKVDKHWRLAAKERLNAIAAQSGEKAALQCF